MKETLSRNEIEDRVRGILSDVLVLKPEEVKLDSLLVDDLDADSISFLELSFYVKKEFGVSFPEVKINEEIINLSLAEGIERLESIGGDTTFLEYTAAEAKRHIILGDYTVRDLALLMDVAIPPEFEAPTVLADLQVKDLEKFGVELQPELVDDEVMSMSLVEGFSILERKLPLYKDPILMSREERSSLLQRLTVKDLSRSVGSNIPPGMDTEAPLSSLRLGDLFRFLTVGSLIGYLEFLINKSQQVES